MTQLVITADDLVWIITLAAFLAAFGAVFVDRSSTWVANRAREWMDRRWGSDD